MQSTRVNISTGRKLHAKLSKWHLVYMQVRESTADAKAQFDNAELSLQNLLYEKDHYLKEIRACQSFRCAFPSIQSLHAIHTRTMSTFLPSNVHVDEVGTHATYKMLYQQCMACMQ